MKKVSIKVENVLGIHARPASRIVQAALKFKSDISLERDGISADGKSIMNVMMLAAAKDCMVTVTAKGPDEEEAIAAIAKLFAEKFNED